MNDNTRMRYKTFLIEIKPRPLRESSEWTTHFSLHRDHLDRMELITNTHMGNKCRSEQDAIEAGFVEARRVADTL